MDFRHVPELALFRESADIVGRKRRYGVSFLLEQGRLIAVSVGMALEEIGGGLQGWAAPLSYATPLTELSA
jgi:hypothetical protein